MKNLTPNLVRFIPPALGPVFALLANPAGATVTTWDPQGSNTQNPYLSSLSQTWENAKWSTSQTGQATPVAWVESTAALFAVHTGNGTPAFTVTMNANHTVAGIFDGPDTPNSCFVTISSGNGSTITIPSGLQGFYAASSSDGSTAQITVNVAMIGSGGVETEGNDTVQLFGNNSY